LAFEVPKLAYDYNALEPYIDEQTMRLHHNKHHQAYVDKLNAALKGKPGLESKSVEELLSDLNAVPKEIRTMVRNHGGGHYNHTLFWQVMHPEGGGQPEGALAEAINTAFRSFEAFKEKFTHAAVTVFGSGWAWLVLDDNNLEIVQSQNQDNPVSQGKKPLLGVDVWEHAYYILYKWQRPEYVKNWWNVVNWPQIEKNYREALGK
jgi:Fe-Mn family superoxide dismutase